MSRLNIINLDDGEIGNLIKITSLHLDGVMRRRLLDLGFVQGAIVEVIRKSPLGDPIAFRVSQTTIALEKRKVQKLRGLISNG